MTMTFYVASSGPEPKDDPDAEPETPDVRNAPVEEPAQEDVPAVEEPE